MLGTALLLVAGLFGHSAAPQWRIYVHPSQGLDTFHFAYPPTWHLEEVGGKVVVSSPDDQIAVTLAALEVATGTLDETVAAMLEAQGEAFAAAPTRESTISMNWRGVSLESRGRAAAVAEDTTAFFMCMRSDSAAYPTVCVSSASPTGLFDANRDVIRRISSSVRFRPAR